MKRIIVTGIVLAGLLAGGIPAAADGPTRAPLVNMPGVIPAGAFCPFAIDVSFPVNDESIITFYDSSGNPVKALVNGHLVVSLTALFANGSTDTVTLNVSGPGIIIYNADGSQTITFLGNSNVFIQTATGTPELLDTSGRFVTIVPSGSLTGLGSLVFAAGKMANICSLFA
jgi:hypothetical protein